MKKVKEIEFESLLQNEEFVRLLNEEPLKGDLFLEDLCRENPDKEQSIQLAASLVRSYRAEQKDVDLEKITFMWNNILRKTETKKPERIYRMTPFWRVAISVAASVAILFSLTFYLLETSGDRSLRKLAEEKVGISDEARIIISDGSEYNLKSNDSHVRYDSDGKEILIEEKNDQNKKIDLQKTQAGNIYNQIIVPYGRRHSVTLSDGSVIQLNSGSKLVFPVKFTGTKREVFLKGEAYFEVAKNAGKPFIVKTDFINIRVLGTHFNISAYENEKSASAVLVEGSIEVYNNNIIKNDLSRVKPGQGCFFMSNSPGFSIHSVDVNEYVSWKDGFLQFKDLSFGNVIKKVERFYNKSISFEDENLANRVLSGKLILADNFKETLDFLAKTTKSRYIAQNENSYVFVK